MILHSSITNNSPYSCRLTHSSLLVKRINLEQHGRRKRPHPSPCNDGSLLWLPKSARATQASPPFSLQRRIAQGDASVPTLLPATPAPTRPCMLAPGWWWNHYRMSSKENVISSFFDAVCSAFFSIRIRALPVTHGPNRHSPL